MKDILKVALSQYGVKEINGPENNPDIMKYFHETGRTWVNSEETPWCDAAMDWCAMKADVAWSPGLNARGWLKVGESVPADQVDELALEIPIIVVLWRVAIDSVYGHVGLLIKRTPGFVYMLGGNQGNEFKISAYPIDQVLDYRRLLR